MRIDIYDVTVDKRYHGNRFSNVPVNIANAITQLLEACSDLDTDDLDIVYSFFEGTLKEEETDGK